MARMRRLPRGADVSVTECAVVVHIVSLCHTLDTMSEAIEIIRGVGSR